jgi:uncharacterized protein (TIGR03663 family)
MFAVKESRAYYVVLFIIIVVAIFLRLFLLDLRPLHSDEGVNFSFMKTLIDNHRYEYNPGNYHGPILYYLTIIPLSIAGLQSSLLSEDLIKNGEYAFRFMPVIMGFGLVLMLLPLKKWLNWSGLLTAMALAAISPSLVYFSRDNIHEIYLAFFTVGTFVMGYLYFTTIKDKFLYLAAMFLALMFTAKETTIVTLVIFCLSAIGATIFSTKPFGDVRKRFLASIKEAFIIYKKPLLFILIGITFITVGMILFSSGLMKKYELKWYFALATKGISMMTIFLVFILLFGKMRKRYSKFIIAWIIFFAVIFILFSSFFKHSDGVGKFFKAFEMWTDQGTVESKQTKPFLYYTEILGRFELPALIFGIAGIILSFWKRKPEELFTAFYAIGAYFAFSLIPYKTPWCVQNMILPLIILSGVSIKYLFEMTPSFVLRSIYVPVIVIVLFNNFCLSLDANIISYDNDSYKIVYVQTSRNIKDMVARIYELSDVKYVGRDTPILITSPDNFPLNWYLRNYKVVQFSYNVVSDADNYPIIIAKKDQEPDLERTMKKKYQKESYSLRSGVVLTLYYQGEDIVKVVPEKYKLEQVIDLSSAGSTLESGLKATVYQHAFFKGKVLAEKVDTKIDFRYDTDAEKPYLSPFSIIWNGYLKVPTSGDYTLVSISDDGSFIYVDDILIVDNGGEHGEQRIAKDVYLASGYHKIQVRYFDIMGGAIMRLYWLLPGQANENPITGEYLYHQK